MEMMIAAGVHQMEGFFEKEQCIHNHFVYSFGVADSTFASFMDWNSDIGCEYRDDGLVGTWPADAGVCCFGNDVACRNVLGVIRDFVEGNTEEQKNFENQFFADGAPVGIGCFFSYMDVA
ncbi:hypothetical protein [Anoxynatronum buryatiense]|uniref:Uncharacterized protein n=1 Tax=Anoxynatronum buryatiense TaxID=489973 RepID=A0AA46AJD9_9CLOT|nr:hypothetical protein [Anoxynatronum buryatiense]SMP59853.1 hypothetical protein SAMN06296020_10811 [Anoxynatronum buryatiense]